MSGRVIIMRANGGDIVAIFEKQRESLRVVSNGGVIIYLSHYNSLFGIDEEVNGVENTS